MQISRVHALMTEALDYRNIRQDLISSNIANVDTPGYRSRDLSFEATLAQKKRAIFTEQNRQLALAKTDAKHLDPYRQRADHAQIFFRDGHLARNDGNSVDLDVETTEMAKNMVMYNATIAALKKDSALFRMVLDTSSKV